MPTDLPVRRAVPVHHDETPLQIFVWQLGVLVFFLTGLLIAIETGAFPASCEFPELLMP